MDEQSITIDYRPIKRALDEIADAIVNRLEREHRSEISGYHKQLPTILKLTLRVTKVTWESIRFLCAQHPIVHARREEFAISVPPLARTMLDSLLTVLYIFDRPSENARWYVASGWRELSEHHALLVGKHGADPEWAEWLTKHAEMVSGWESDAAISPTEKADPKRIKYWPNPGRMAQPQSGLALKDQVRLAFAQYLNDWFYRHLSGASHLSLSGLASRGGLLADAGDREERARMMTRYHSRVILTALSLYVAFLSELAGQFKLDFESARLRSIWKHILEWPEANELHKERYDGWLV
jgi:hypothetical protein